MNTKYLIYGNILLALAIIFFITGNLILAMIICVLAIVLFLKQRLTNV